MELAELIARQKSFDEAHESRFEWSRPASSDDTQPLLYLVLALAGEVGELANIVKKLERGDLTYIDALACMKEEVADVLIYLLKLSYQTGIDLELAFDDKLRVNVARFARMEKRRDEAVEVGRYRPLLGLKALSASELRSSLEAFAARLPEPSRLSHLRELVTSPSASGATDDRSLVLAGLAALVLADIGGTMSPYLREAYIRNLRAACFDLGVDFEFVQRLSSVEDALQDVFQAVPQL